MSEALVLSWTHLSDSENFEGAESWFFEGAGIGVQLFRNSGFSEYAEQLAAELGVLVAYEEDGHRIVSCPHPNWHPGNYREPRVRFDRVDHPLA